MKAEEKKRTVGEVYHRLLGAYGPQGWWPVSPGGGAEPVYSGGPRNDLQRLEVIVGAVLTQNTSWSGASRAVTALLRAGCLDVESLLDIPREELARLIRPSGYFNQKARRIKGLVSSLSAWYDGNWRMIFGEPDRRMRELLLSLDGVGPETADSIMLYAAGRASFVVDAYTRRLFFRLGVTAPKASYDELKSLFECSLEPDREIFGEYHALVVEHCKQHCAKRVPLCRGCPLEDICRKRGVGRK